MIQNIFLQNMQVNRAAQITTLFQVYLILMILFLLALALGKMYY